MKLMNNSYIIAFYSICITKTMILEVQNSRHMLQPVPRCLIFWVRVLLSVLLSESSGCSQLIGPQVTQVFLKLTQLVKSMWSCQAAVQHFVVVIHSPVLFPLPRWTNQGSSCHPGTITLTRQLMRRWEFLSLQVGCVNKAKTSLVYSAYLRL